MVNDKMVNLFVPQDANVLSELYLCVLNKKCITISPQFVSFCSRRSPEGHPKVTRRSTENRPLVSRLSTGGDAGPSRAHRIVQ